MKKKLWLVVVRSGEIVEIGWIRASQKPTIPKAMLTLGLNGDEVLIFDTTQKSVVELP